jgi:hypothetical protein
MLVGSFDRHGSPPQATGVLVLVQEQLLRPRLPRRFRNAEDFRHREDFSWTGEISEDLETRDLCRLSWPGLDFFGLGWLMMDDGYGGV